MGSRLMHLLVADYVASELDIRDRGQMFLGALAPDAVQDKPQSHFQGALHLHALNAPIDYGRFVVKYLQRFDDPYFVGYLTHLVMDDVWTMKTDFNGFEARLKKKPELYQMYHGDLWLCNAKFIEMYKALTLKDLLTCTNDVPNTEEVLCEQVLIYRQLALKDFDYPVENLAKPLTLFTLEDMVHYVERSKSKALDVCRIVHAKVNGTT